MSVDLLHEKPNGSWSLAMAEMNKWIFFKAYFNRINDVAERRALKEAEYWLQNTIQPNNGGSESKLLKEWKKNPPETEVEWKRWITIHQRHLFVPLSVRGAFYQDFPAISKRSREVNYELTKLFYEGLRKRAK